MPDNAGLEPHKPTSLEGRALTASLNKEHRFRNLYGELTPEFLLTAWTRIKKDASSGVDKITAEDYSRNLTGNLEGLALRLKEKTYTATLVRRTYIPKENGKERPLGIPALEDKSVQRAVTMVLNAIYEQDFLDVSDGYRAGKSANDAVADLTFQLQFGRFGYVVEADIQGFFDNIDQDWLLKMLALRIDDSALLNLIRKWLKAGILEPDGMVIDPETGTPQGGLSHRCSRTSMCISLLTCGVSRSSNSTVKAKPCCAGTRMTGSAPFATNGTPNDVIGCCQRDWTNSV